MPKASTFECDRTRVARDGPGFAIRGRSALAGARWLSTSLLLACCAPAQTGDASAAQDAAAHGDAGAAPCDPWPTEVPTGRLGSDEDSQTPSRALLVLMGGGAEIDAAARSFVEGAVGGDVLVLRASGSVDSYTSYFFAELGAVPAPASVTTALLAQPTPAADPAVTCRVDAAEALWLAGGDQSDYLVAWPAVLQQALARVGARGGSMGGTSAGAMALGEVAFDAARGSVDSVQALAAPLSSVVSVSRSPFAHPFLASTVVDTHFQARDREGRLLTFLARALALLGQGPVLGLGLDEEAALVIESGHFLVLAAPGQRVWLYRAAGPATLETAAGLGLDGVERVQLTSGQQGTWPPDLASWPVVRLQVVNGVVQEL